MVKVRSRMPANTTIVLFAAVAAANQCISGEKKIMRGTWKGKQIDYMPGRLMVGLRNGTSLEKATRLIDENNANVDYIFNGVIDVIVEPRLTLDIASKLDALGAFKFVTPEIICKPK